MEREGNYVIVGMFMLLLIGLGVGFVLWYSKAADRRDYTPYEIYFTGSVSGLDQGSVVRYLGVDVGRVRRMSLDHDRPTAVKVVVDIDKDAPISAATRASLSMQGVTGLLFINLKQDPDADASKPPQMGENYPRIESVSSDFDVLLASLPELVGRASKLLQHIDQVFSQQNISAVSQTVENLRDTTQSLPKTAAQVAKVVEQLQRTLDNVNGAAAGIRSIAEDSRPQVKQALDRLQAAAKNLSDSTKRIDAFVASAQVQVGHLSDHGLFELERLLRDARAAANEFGDLSRSLKEQPSQLMYEKPNSGTEIRR